MLSPSKMSFRVLIDCGDALPKDYKCPKWLCPKLAEKDFCDKSWDKVGWTNNSTEIEKCAPGKSNLVKEDCKLSCKVCGSYFCLFKLIYK